MVLQMCLLLVALRIAVKILFMKYEQKDCNEKPDLQGNAQNIF
jgi:hypothetical protein